MYMTAILTEVYNTYLSRRDVFPSGYYRYLKGSLAAIIDNGTYMYRDGVFIGWKRSKVNRTYGGVSVPPGSIMVDKVISKHQGRGYCRALFIEFLESHRGHLIFLKVACDNHRAFDLYQRLGFKVVETLNQSPPRFIMAFNI